jgi:hypothetical protein
MCCLLRLSILKLAHKCPHCRQQPLTLIYEFELQPAIDRKRHEARNRDKTHRDFKCAIKNCT